MTVKELRELLYNFNEDSLVEVAWDDNNPEAGDGISKITAIKNYENGKTNELVVIRTF